MQNGPVCCFRVPNDVWQVAERCSRTGGNMLTPTAGYYSLYKCCQRYSCNVSNWNRVPDKGTNKAYSWCPWIIYWCHIWKGFNSLYVTDVKCSLLSVITWGIPDCSMVQRLSVDIRNNTSPFSGRQKQVMSKSPKLEFLRKKSFLVSLWSGICMYVCAHVV
jgi:hypothetical protein